MDDLNDCSRFINCNLKNYAEKTSQTKCFLFLIASNNYPNRVLKFKLCLELEKRKGEENREEGGWNICPNIKLYLFKNDILSCAPLLIICPYLLILNHILFFY